MMRTIEKLMDKYLLPYPPFQRYINHRFKDSGKIVVDESYVKGVYHRIGDFEYELSDQMGTVIQTEDYDISDLRKDDIVLDIGANVGAFSMKASRLCRHIYAVEPMYTDVLRRNIQRNKIDNITVFDCGLGIHNQYLEYGVRKRYVGMRSLQDILNMCKGADFLKMDCEGSYKYKTGEYCIKPDELKCIRRIEAEIHHYETGRPKRSPFEDILDKAGFEYAKEDSCQDAILIHARR